MLIRMLKAMHNLCSDDRLASNSIREALAHSVKEIPAVHDADMNYVWQMVISIAGTESCSAARIVWESYQKLVFTLFDRHIEDPSVPLEMCRAFVHHCLTINADNSIIHANQRDMLLQKYLIHYQMACTQSTQTLSPRLQRTLEWFATSADIVANYQTLEPKLRVPYLQFVADVLRENSTYDPTEKQQRIATDLAEHLCTEFKRKSDCVLKTEASYADRIEPREVYALLEVISLLSADPAHTSALAADASLFLNVGCLLASVTALGQQSSNMFTPVAQLGQIAPNSGESAAIQRDVSFDMKTLLVRTLANLSYRNERNQQLAREMGILAAVLNCTTVDARNPLIKEWSVLAIRHLCEGCVENQELVRGLTKVGEADHSGLLKELNLEMGAMRIGGQ